MDAITDELLGIPGTDRAAIFIIRLVTAALLGGLLGAERESVGKAAGLRTHMLVALGAALFVIAPREAGLAEVISVESFKASQPASDSSAPERFSS